MALFLVDQRARVCKGGQCSDQNRPRGISVCLSRELPCVGNLAAVGQVFGWEALKCVLCSMPALLEFAAVGA